MVLEDQQFPHTGWFVQSKTSTVVKEYNYQLIDDKFVSWNVRETRNGTVNQWSNLIYVQRAFAKSITITQKRALFYAFKVCCNKNVQCKMKSYNLISFLKSLVVRDRDGPLAGIYCWLKSNEVSVTCFYPDAGKRKQVKLAIGKVGTDEMNGHLAKIAKHLRGVSHGTALGFLQGTLRALKTIIEDKEFMEDMLELDDWVEEDF